MISASAPLLRDHTVGNPETAPGNFLTPEERVRAFHAIIAIGRLVNEEVQAKGQRLIFRWHADTFSMDEEQGCSSCGLRHRLDTQCPRIPPSWPRPRDYPLAFGYNKLEDWT